MNLEASKVSLFWQKNRERVNSIAKEMADRFGQSIEDISHDIYLFWVNELLPKKGLEFFYSGQCFGYTRNTLRNEYLNGKGDVVAVPSVREVDAPFIKALKRQAKNSSLLDLSEESLFGASALGDEENTLFESLEDEAWKEMRITFSILSGDIGNSVEISSKYEGNKELLIKDIYTEIALFCKKREIPDERVKEIIEEVTKGGKVFFSKKWKGIQSWYGTYLKENSLVLVRTEVSEKAFQLSYNFGLTSSKHGRGRKRVFHFT